MYKRPSAARGVKTAYEHLLGANLREQVPAWLKAMRSVPPVNSLVRDPADFSTCGRLEFEKSNGSGQPMAQQADKNAGARIKRTLPEGCVALKHKKAFLRTRSTKPPRIEFPEDRLRRKFYKNHPFEKARPRIVMEPTGKTNQDWSELSQRSGQITGESVIRYQHYLMESEGMSEEEAYSLATEKFYQIRAREEIEAKVAQQEAKALGAKTLDKPYSKYQLRVEDREIRRSAKVFAIRQEQQRIRSAATEKSFGGGVDTE